MTFTEVRARREDLLARARASVGNGAGLAGVDLETMPQPELRAWGEALGQVRREVDLMLAKVAHAQAQRSTADAGPQGMARRTGQPTPRGLVSGQTGGSEFEAGRLIEVGEVLDQSRELGDGVRVAGATDRDEPPTTGLRFLALPAAVEGARVSVEAAAMISRMLRSVHAVADPAQWAAAERELVAKATLLNLRQLSRVVRQTEARLHRTAIEERERAHRNARFLHLSEDQSGMIRITGLLDAETAAPIKVALDAIVGKALQAKRDNNAVVPDVRSAPQMRADALAILARHILGCDEKALPREGATLVVRIAAGDVQHSIDAQARGEATAGLATIDGIGTPISAGAARRLCGDAEVVPVTLTAESAILDYGRRRRAFSLDQKLALVERDGGCAMCGAPPSWCEAHHIREWTAHEGPTDLDNGLLLCTRCHHDLHRQGWIVHATPTQVWFTPPATIDPERRRRPGGRMLHDGVPLDPVALQSLERASQHAVGAAASRRQILGQGENSAQFHEGAGDHTAGRRSERSVPCLAAPLTTRRSMTGRSVTRRAVHQRCDSVVERHLAML